MTNDAKTQHTPGPWSVKHGEVLFGDQSRQPKGAQETIICDPSAGCYYADGKRKCLPIDEREANARLIAAAPELLALVTLSDEVERLANLLACSKTNDERNPIIHKLATAQHQYKEARRAAIAKAEGRA